MISFGAPVDLYNPSQYAVDAAKDLLKALTAADAGTDLGNTRIGIGLHTGEVVTRNIGIADRQHIQLPVMW